VTRQFAKAIFQLAEGNEGGALDAADGLLVRLAHVEEEMVISRMAEIFEFVDSHGWHVGSCRTGLGNAAEALVINGLGDGGFVAAHRTVGIAAQRERAKAHAQRVEVEKLAEQGLADAGDQFDGLERLHRSDQAGQHAENATFGT